MEFENVPYYIKNMIYEFYTKYGKRILPIRTFIRASTVVVEKTGKKNLNCVEIGVDHGFNAKTMLETLSIKKLYLIDVKLKKKTRERLSKYKDKIKFIENYSDKAAPEIPNEQDFIYVDGGHDYDCVKKDIELYYPKVKNGGIFGGHDFDANHMDICRAVFEFVQKNNLKLYGKNSDWWIIKGEKKK
jgi:hypothetical protein